MDSVEELPQNTGLPQEPGQLPSPSSPSGNKGKEPQQPPSKRTTVRRRTKTGCLTCRRRRIKCDEGKPTCSNCIKSKRECEGYSQRLTFKEPLGSFPASNLYGHPVYHRQVQEALLNAQISAAKTQAASSQGPLAVIAPKPPSVDFSGAGPVPFGQGYPAPIQPQYDGPPVFKPAHHLPSPPFQDHPPSPLHGKAVAHGDFYQGPGAAQSFQPLTTLDYVQPDFAGQRVPVSGGAGQSLASPDSGDGRLNRASSAEEGYWQSDDEASMGESDDDINPDAHIMHLESNDLGIRVARRLESHHDVYGVGIRSFAGLADDNVLETYTPSSDSSPLNDSQTAAVFWYFVNVTGQSMSLYERHPFDPSPLFQGQPVPKQRQHIWTYTFPIMAFNHPALMQAMLALGSLQMAKLQGQPPTAAMKHYHLCLRRIAKNYQSPSRRTQPATLAATLLLGFYEVWNSDHDKWCKHMWGARAILREIPLARMTRDVLAFKRRQREQAIRNHQCNEHCYAAHGDLSVDLGEVDTELIFQLSGQRVDYGGGSGYVVGDAPRPSRLTQRDIETYEQLRDLYWWYCKMDVYQSFLGGTRLLMDYQSWTQCEPRGPFGKIDSIHGTYDYLILMLGRLASFASRDLARKRRARRAQGPPGQGPPGQGPPGQGPPGQGPPGKGPPGQGPLGQGPPGQGPPGQGPPGQGPPGQGPPGQGPPGQGPPGQGPPGQGPPGQGRGPGPGQGPGMGRGQSPPMFAGLMPSSGRVTVPRGFSPPREASPASDSMDDMDFDVSTANALHEWEEIRKAFELFRARLGPDFEPMGPDFALPEQTPFGPALMYRTYSIAGIWMNYYMGLIILHRSHPSMPPIAVVAAGMVAHQTGRWANEIARIAAGLHEDTTHVPAVSTLVGAAFIESCFPLFVAGVQYQDLHQRHWTIRRLRDMARLTGWQSARQIADGCETGWNKAAELGRGPPYHSPPELGPLFPDSVWNRPRRIDRRIQELEAGDNRLVLAKSEQAHYALGLLSVEKDLDTLDIEDEGEDRGQDGERGAGGSWED